MIVHQADASRLTYTQVLVLNFLQSFQAQHGYMPTRREIAENFRWKSGNNADLHVKALIRKGVITNPPGTARVMRFTEKGLALLDPSRAAVPGTLEPSRFLCLPVVDVMGVNHLGRVRAA